MRIADSRPVRLAVAFLLVVSLSGAVPSAAAAAAANANPPPPNASAELALRAYAILDEQAHRPGADPSDIAYMAGKLGFDANRIFVFVRDETRLEPYRGVLRGARGVLAGRAGNSLDRALLLQAQLTESGVPCRLMQGKLPDATARQALDQFLNAPQAAPPPPPAGDDSDPGATKLLQRAGVPDSLAAEIRDRCTAHSAAFWRSVSSQSDERAAYLAGQLTAAGLKPPKADAIQKELLDSLKTHYWVQRQDAEGKWIDLDPLLTSLQPGQTAGQDGKPAGAIAASLRHQLDFSLIYRTKQGNGGKEEVVLKRTVDAADAPFKPMAFAVQSADTDLPAPFNMTNQQKVDLVRRMKKFQGIFRAGSEMTAGRPFDLKGNTYDVQPGGVIGNASGVGQATGGAFGGFGGALGGGGPKPPANTFVDLRVVMTLRSPGRQPITQTRVLTTAADPVAPLLNWELFLQPAFSPDKLMEYQFTDYLARQRPYVEAILAPKPGAVPIPNNWPFPIYAASISMLRNAALRRTLGSESGVVPLMDHPNLFMTSHSVRVNAAGTGTEGRWGVDLVEMGLNFVPKAAANESTALNLALRQSVAESTIEQVFLANSFPANALTSSAARFDLARATGAATKVIHAKDAAALKSLNWADADTKDLGTAEPASQLIVATAATADEPPSWWTVAPNGTAVARSRGGFGEAETDYMEITLNVACKILCFIEMLNAGKGGHQMLSFMLCAGMQAGGGAAEMIAEEMEFEGMGFIVSAIDLTIWAVMGMTEPEE